MIKHVLRFWGLCLAFTLVLGGMSAAAYSQDADEPDIAILELIKKIKQDKEKFAALKKQRQEKQEQKNQAILQIAKAIKVGECVGLHTKLEEEINWFEGTMQLINARGICGPKTPQLAFDFMKTITQNKPRDEKAWAYLGRFYEQGIGTEVNLKKAKHAYQFAVRALAVQVLKTEWNDAGYHPNRSIAQHWKLSVKDYVWSFANSVLGPIEISALLEAEIQWLRDIEVEGGEAVFKEAKDMLRQGKEGSTGWFASIVDWVLSRQNDTKANLVIGFEWLDKAGGKYKHVPSYYPLAKAFRNIDIVENLPEYNDGLNSAALGSNVYLVKAMQTGTKKALMPVVQLLRETDDFGTKYYSLYYLLLKLQKNGFDVSQVELESVKSNLSPNHVWSVHYIIDKPEFDTTLAGIFLVKKLNFPLPN